MSEPIWFRHQLRVRYAETDQMGVVYHANYLDWFEIGRTELLRELGHPYQSIEAEGLLLPLIEAQMKFKQPARYDDLITIYTRIAECSPVRLEFHCEIRRAEQETAEAGGAAAISGELLQTTQKAGQAPIGELLVSGLTRHVCVNPSWKPVRIDKEAPALWRLITTNKE